MIGTASASIIGGGHGSSQYDSNAVAGTSVIFIGHLGFGDVFEDNIDQLMGKLYSNSYIDG